MKLQDLLREVEVNATEEVKTTETDTPVGDESEKTDDIPSVEE
jgi:hypothetical protein